MVVLNVFTTFASKSDFDADSHREELIKVTDQRDAALKDVEVKKSALEEMKLQVGKNLKTFLSQWSTCNWPVNHLMT